MMTKCFQTSSLFKMSLTEDFRFWFQFSPLVASHSLCKNEWRNFQGSLITLKWGSRMEMHAIHFQKIYNNNSKMYSFAACVFGFKLLCSLLYFWPRHGNGFYFAYLPYALYVIPTVNKIQSELKIWWFRCFFDSICLIVDQCYGCEKNNIPNCRGFPKKR